MTWQRSNVIAGVGEVLRRATDEGRGHVHHQLLERLGSTVVGDEIGLEAPERVGATARGREQQARPVEVDEQADVVVATPPARLVEPDPAGVADVSDGFRLGHVVVKDAPDPVSCSPTSSATAFTGISATSAMTNASNSRVKPGAWATSPGPGSAPAPTSPSRPPRWSSSSPPSSWPSWPPSRGLPTEQVTQGVAAVLPDVVNTLTPDGTLPDHAQVQATTHQLRSALSGITASKP